ncbi:zinc finger, CCHC-type containing protein [Tanacetum coccineum]
MFDEDVVDHIAKVLELLDLIKIPGVDSHRLRMKVFHLSLADDARQWWINEKEGKITTWEELVEKFFCKFYPESHNGEDEMLNEGNNWGINPLEFISRVNSSFENHMKVDGMTKKKSNYGNPLNTATDSFFKAHNERDIKEGNELRKMKRKGENKNDEHIINVYTTYSLNEYSVFDTGINTAYPEVWIQGPRWKEIDNVGGVLINLEI